MAHSAQVFAALETANRPDINRRASPLKPAFSDAKTGFEGRKYAAVRSGSRLKNPVSEPQLNDYLSRL
ncbi:MULTISPECIES: hypothetical protein [unclassified Microcoleus]|uniref:hypothetical protein n=1 Tax=unclassified Microcoleus TaxID=2642155 RepID=UPI002FD06E9E